MTRCTEDLILAMTVMSGVNAKKLRLDETIDIQKIKVFYREDTDTSFGVEPVSEDIKRVIRAAATHLMESCGSQVKKVG